MSFQFSVFSVQSSVFSFQCSVLSLQFSKSTPDPMLWGLLKLKAFLTCPIIQTCKQSPIMQLLIHQNTQNFRLHLTGSTTTMINHKMTTIYPGLCQCFCHLTFSTKESGQPIQLCQGEIGDGDQKTETNTESKMTKTTKTTSSLPKREQPDRSIMPGWERRHDLTN